MSCTYNCSTLNCMKSDCITVYVNICTEQMLLTLKYQQALYWSNCQKLQIKQFQEDWEHREISLFITEMISIWYFLVLCPLHIKIGFKYFFFNIVKINYSYWVNVITLHQVIRFNVVRDLLWTVWAKYMKCSSGGGRNCVCGESFNKDHRQDKCVHSLSL